MHDTNEQLGDEIRSQLLLNSFLGGEGNHCVVGTDDHLDCDPSVGVSDSVGVADAPGDLPVQGDGVVRTEESDSCDIRPEAGMVLGGLASVDTGVDGDVRRSARAGVGECCGDGATGRPALSLVVHSIDNRSSKRTVSRKKDAETRRKLQRLSQ